MRSYRLYLEDIQVSAAKIQRYTKGLSFEDFFGNELVFDAVLRNLEIIGEAAKNVPTEVRQRYPDVEWRRIAGLRDVLAHAYFNLENVILWDIVQNRVSLLLKQVEHILELEG